MKRPDARGPGTLSWSVLSLVALLLACGDAPIVVVPVGKGAGPAPICHGFASSDFARRRALRGPLVDARGQPVPSHLHVTGDRARWCAVAHAPGGRLRRGRAVAPHRVRVTRRDGGIHIATGLLDATLSPDGSLRTGAVDIAPVVEDGAVRGLWSIAHACPVRVTVVYEQPAGRSRCRRRWTWTFHAGTARVDAAQWVFAEENTALAAGAGWRVRSSDVREVRAGEVARGEEVFALDRDGRLWSDRVSDRLVGLASDAGSMLGIGPWSWRLFCGVASVVREGPHVTLLGVAPGVALDRGEGRLLRAVFARGLEAPAEPSAVEVGEPGLRRLTQGVEVAARRAFERLIDDGARGFIRDGVGRGDWRFARDQVGNGEYDTTLGLLAYGRRFKDPRALSAARRLADHLLGVDRDAVGSGLFFPHGRGHRASPVEFGHHWVEGLIALDALEPDPLRGRLLDSLLVGQLAAFERANLEEQLPRSLGWGLLALSVSHERRGLHRARTRTQVARWRSFILERQARGGWLGLVGLSGDPDVGNENPFVQGGIILPALVRSQRVLRSRRARAATLALARALARDAVKVIDGQHRLALRCVVDRRSGRVLSRSGAAPGEYAALFLAGIGACESRLLETGALRLLERAIPTTLRCDDKRYIGAELSILMRSLR